jgi:hypothetical protein
VWQADEFVGGFTDADLEVCPVQIKVQDGLAGGGFGTFGASCFAMAFQREGVPA